MFPSGPIFELQSGIPGEVGVRVPSLAVAVLLDSADPQNNVFGRAFTYLDESMESAQAGGSGLFAGFLALPKAYAVNTLGEPLDVLPNQRQCELIQKGEVYVLLTVGNPVSIGSRLFYDVATGAVGAGVAGAGQIAIDGATVVRHNPSAPGAPCLALVRVNISQSSTPVVVQNNLLIDGDPVLIDSSPIIFS
jgi:hypothetical protein